jgi:predicted secreted hydrolase
VRRFLLCLLILIPACASAEFAIVTPGYELRFPRDEGSHPDFRIEWWYVTGWLEDYNGISMGFQLTFFRARTGESHENPSRFSPRQLLIAHSALSDPRERRLLHDERSAREGFGLAGASTGKTEVWIGNWSLKQDGNRYFARVSGERFSLDLELQRAQAPLLQGSQGFSKKGVRQEAASYYYSLPHLKVSGKVARDGKTREVIGIAWLDHEWTSQYLDAQAVGWDWVGINLDDGGALMAFRMRAQDGGEVWAAGTHRLPNGEVRVLNREQIAFSPLAIWQSPRTGTGYPVEMRVTAGEIDLRLAPIMPDQELDARESSGTIYYEGAVKALQDGQVVGRGYLELTGYWKRLGMPGGEDRTLTGTPDQ